MDAPALQAGSRAFSRNEDILVPVGLLPQGKFDALLASWYTITAQLHTAACRPPPTHLVRKAFSLEKRLITSLSLPGADSSTRLV